MTDPDNDLEERAEAMDLEFYDHLDEHTSDGGGCMELAEALAEARREE